MRHLVAVTVLAGCASAVPSGDPCACVVLPDPNGAMSVAFDGTPLQLDGDEGGAYDTTPVFGSFFTSEDGRSVVTHGIGVDAAAGFGISAEWAPGAGYGTATPADVTSVFFMTGLRADTEYISGTAYALGPAGGTLHLRQIEARDDGDWRVRGDYAAQVCPETGVGPCATLTGEFAYTVNELPDPAATPAP